MEVTITYADYDKKIKNSTLSFEDLTSMSLNIKEVITEQPMIPIEPSTPVEPPAPEERNTVADEEGIVKVDVLEITTEFLESQVKIEMPYSDLQEYISLLQKIAKQIRPIN